MQRVLSDIAKWWGCWIVAVVIQGRNTYDSGEQTYWLMKNKSFEILLCTVLVVTQLLSQCFDLVLCVCVCVRHLHIPEVAYLICLSYYASHSPYSFSRQAIGYPLTLENVSFKWRAIKYINKRIRIYSHSIHSNWFTSTLPNCGWVKQRFTKLL